MGSCAPVDFAEELDLELLPLGRGLMNEIRQFCHPLQVGGEGELAAPALGCPGQQLAHRGPGNIDCCPELRFRGGRYVIGNDIETANEQARGPASADEAGAGDADCVDGGGHLRPFRPRTFRASSGVAILEPKSAMILVAFSTRAPFEAWTPFSSQ